MRKLLALASLFVATIFVSTTETFAQTTVHYVKQGETFWTIAKHYNVPLLELQRINQKQTDVLFVGETLRIPQPISQADKDLLARLVHAEAKGEPFAGKVAVATVALNRVDHPNFPNTIRQVIYDRSGGYYAFTPVQNGEINKPADREAYRAVEEAIAFRGLGSGSLYFYNPKTAKSEWIRSRQVTVIIGNHVFAK